MLLEAETAGASRVTFTYRGRTVKAQRGGFDREDGTRDWYRTVRARGNDAAGNVTVDVKVRACKAGACDTVTRPRAPRARGRRLMRRALIIGVLVAAGAGVGAGTVLASGALGEDAPVEVITVPSPTRPARPPAGSSSRTASRAPTPSGCPRRRSPRCPAPRSPRSATTASTRSRCATARAATSSCCSTTRFRVVGTDGDED